MSRAWHRWLPAGAVTVAIAGTVVITAQAGAASLPDRSAEDVLAMLAEQSVTAYSGSFEQSADLGLPALPGGPGGFGGHGAASQGATEEPSDDAAAEDAATDMASVLELVTGDHTGRVYVGGPGRARLQITDELAERNLVVNDRDVWSYDSASDAATHLTLPDPADLPGHPERPDAGSMPTPEQLAADLVAALEPSTELGVDDAEVVAGRDAYTLTLRPRAEETLVGEAAVTVDGETGFPLAVTLTARGANEPAYRLAYTDIDLSAPDASLFDFSPPAGATVTEHDVPVPGPHDGRPGTHPGTDDADVQIIGEGWSTVAVAPVGRELLADEPLLAELTEPVAGGRLLSTSLLTVLLTDDGRVLAGPVTSAHLQELAGS